MPSFCIALLLTLLPGQADLMNRFEDVTGDGLRDVVTITEAGYLTVAVNRQGRVFEVAMTELPIPITSTQDILISDLDGDGHLDLYLVGPGPNLALCGDSTGYFIESTDRLGLADAGCGLHASRSDLDGDGLADLVLRNRETDVLFWAETGGVFSRHTPNQLASPPMPVTARAEPAVKTSPVGVVSRNGDIAEQGALESDSRSGTPGKPAAKGRPQVSPSPRALTPSSTPKVAPPDSKTPPSSASQSPGAADRTGRNDDDPNTTATPGLGSAGTTKGTLGSEVGPDARYVNDNQLEVEGPTDIVDETVTGDDIQDGSLTGADVSTSSGDVTFQAGIVTVDSSSNGEIARFRSSSPGNSWISVIQESGGPSQSHLNLGVGSLAPTQGTPYLFSSNGSFFFGPDGDPKIQMGLFPSGTLSLNSFFDSGGGFHHPPFINLISDGPHTDGGGPYLDFYSQGAGTGNQARVRLWDRTLAFDAQEGFSYLVRSLSLGSPIPPLTAFDVSVESFGSAANASASSFLKFTDVGAGTTPFRVSGSGRLEATSHENGLATFAGSTSGNHWVTVSNAAGTQVNLGIGSQTPDPYLYSSTGRLFFGPDGAPSTILKPTGLETKVLEITGADLVEAFETADGTHEPGSVLVIDPENAGELILSQTPYDKKVAGIVSGANGIEHGIQMGKDSALDGDHLIAMTGRVYVKCSTENGAIEPGDLLTTASLPGHAMKASDSSRAFGSVIGKAMTGLEDGEGFVLVLVSLQ